VDLLGRLTRFVTPAHAVGVTVFVQVGSVAAARAAAAAGADGVVVQGTRAGVYIRFPQAEPIASPASSALCLPGSASTPSKPTT
jgi:NAD(P)H-dependent flavin oxidoreductase YrpB (nitropropane dioxygenase family)